MQSTKDLLAIDPGELRHQVSIQSRTSTPSPTGSPQDSWTTVRTTMAAILGMGSKEVYQAAQFVSQVTHVVKVRWTADTVVAGNRVVFGPRTFTVQSVVNPLERNRVLLIYCLEINGVQ